jgi:cytoskeletal protein RodZ
MKRKHDLHVLRQADAATAQKIAEQYPADWDMEHVFRRSYQKYLAASPEKASETAGTAADAPDFQAVYQPKKSIRMYTSRYATAACLVLTAGIAGLVGYGLLSASKQNLAQPVQTSDDLAIVVETTASQTEITQANVIGTVTTAVSLPEAEPAQTVTEEAQTALPTQTDTESQPPAVTLAVETASAVTETAAQPDAAATEPETAETTSPDKPVKMQEGAGSRFQVTENETGSVLKFSYANDLAPAVYSYASVNPRFTVTEDTDDGSMEGIAYKVTDTEEHRSFRFFVYYRNSLVPFQYSVSGYDVSETEIGGRQAIRQDTRKQDSKWGCMITWFDGNTVCQISGYQKYAETMIQIAETMQPAT